MFTSTVSAHVEITGHSSSPAAAPSPQNLEPIELVMLPGLDGTGVAFRPIVELLPAYVRPTVIVYPPDRVLGYAELLDLIKPQLPDRPFVLLGESFGSPLAIQIMASRPPGLCGLILSAAFARNPLILRPNWLAHLARPVVFRTYSPYVRLKAWRRGPGPMTAIRLAGLRPVTHCVISHRARSALRVNVMEELAAADVPILYLRGRRDRLVSRQNLIDMSRCRPSMQTEELDGGHCLLRSRPQLALPIILDFIGQCMATQHSAAT